MSASDQPLPNLCITSAFAPYCLPVLTCIHCGYDLTGLAKGHDAILCPECGGKTRSSEPVPDVDPIMKMGRSALWWLVAPTAVFLLVTLPYTLLLKLDIMTAYDEPVLAVGVACALLTWLACPIAIRFTSQAAAMTRRDRKRLSHSVFVYSTMLLVLAYVLLVSIVFPVVNRLW